MQKWTEAILPLLPATLRDINTNPAIVKMNEQHVAERAKRKRRPTTLPPMNSMAYDTLYSLRRRGLVTKIGKTYYRVWTVKENA